MNEQIKELAEKVDKWFEEDGHSYSRPAWNEKFAELIVEECVSQCWTVSELEHKGNVISECSKRMRNHFGVEV